MMMEKVCDNSSFGVIGRDQISFGEVKFEMLIKYLSRNVEQEAKYINLDFRARNQAVYANLKDINTQILFKIEDWMKITNGISGNREEKIFMNQPWKTHKEVTEMTRNQEKRKNETEQYI